MRCAVLALLPTAAAAAAALSCSLNGDLVDGNKCKCDPQWEGADCHLLKLLPADPHAGLQAPGNFSSWGGSVEKDAAGTYHMYAAVMAHGCGLNAWRPNSQIGHATSKQPAGPYELEQIILPHFAHSPEVVRGARGEWLVYHVGAGADNTTKCPDPSANSCRWTTNCSAGCTGPEHPWLSGLGFYGPASVMKASSPDGPWEDTVIGACEAVPGCEPHGAAFPGNGNDQNPAPFINADGSVTMLWRSINYTKGSGQSVRRIIYSTSQAWHMGSVLPSCCCCSLSHIQAVIVRPLTEGWPHRFMRRCRCGMTVLCRRLRSKMVGTLHVAHSEHLPRVFLLPHRRWLLVRTSHARVAPMPFQTDIICRAFSEWHCTLGDATWRGVALRYKNKRGWHALFHSDCQKGSTAGGAAGGHGYSADGKTWEFHPMNAYDNILKLADGTTWTLNRRER